MGTRARKQGRNHASNETPAESGIHRGAAPTDLPSTFRAIPELGTSLHDARVLAARAMLALGVRARGRPSLADVLKHGLQREIPVLDMLVELLEDERFEIDQCTIGLVLGAVRDRLEFLADDAHIMSAISDADPQPLGGAS